MGATHARATHASASARTDREEHESTCQGHINRMALWKSIAWAGTSLHMQSYL